VLGALKYFSFRSGSDVGLFVQSMQSPALTDTTEAGSHFLFHFSPILYLCAPLVRLTGSAITLITISTVAGALCAPPVYLLVRKRATESLAVAAAFVMLVYPPLVGVTFADFHENVFAAPLTLWLIWAVDGRRWPFAAVFFALLLCVKEDQALMLACASVFALVYFSRRGERAGTVASTAGLLAAASVFTLYFGVLRPAIGGGAWSPAHFYDWNRHVNANETAPLFSFGRLTYVLEAFVPLLFISLLSPIVILAVPGFAEVLLSHESMTYTMGQHYAAVWIGYVLAAFAFGLTTLAAGRALTLARSAFGVCVLILIVASPTHWAHYVAIPTGHDIELSRVIDSLPPDAQVAAPDEIFSHLGFFPRALLGMQGTPEYVLIDTTHTNSALAIRDLPVVRAQAAAGRYRLAFDRDGIELYKRADVKP
jgi:uncharacterized membrane protein